MNIKLSQYILATKEEGLQSLIESEIVTLRIPSISHLAYTRDAVKVLYEKISDMILELWARGIELELEDDRL